MKPEVPSTAHQSPGPREESLSAAARPQSGGLVSLGRGGLRKSARGEQAHLPFHRLLHLPLVPRDGARKSFENDEIAALLNRDFVAIKVDREERPDVDRIYMTFVQATTGSGGWPMSVWLTPELQAVLRRHLFPARESLGPSGLRFHPDADRAGVGAAIARRSSNRRASGGAAQEARGGGAARRAGARLRRGDAGKRLLHLPPHLRFAPRRLRRRAQIPARLGAPFPAALLRAHEEPGSSRHGAAHAARNGQRRHERSAGRRLPPLLGGRPLVRAALREDALRSGADRHLLSGGLPDHRRRASTPIPPAAFSITCCAT